MQQAFEEVFDRVSPGVVSIATERVVNVQVHPFMNDPIFQHFFGAPQGQGGQTYQQKQTGLGSGIILNKEGYILTNEHVVRDMDKLTVKLKNGKSYEAKLVGLDQTVDIALLKIEADSELHPITLGDSSQVKVGDWAIAIGAPLGFEHSFTVGVVSAVGRLGIDSSGVHYLQTDAAINPGNSGGPLLDIYGRVIGINRMIASQSGGSVGIGFAIPINEAKLAAKDLKEHGKVMRPWIGVGIDYVNDQDQKELKLSDKNGAIVRQLAKNSPADEAGMQLLDVIREVDGKTIKTPEEVIEIVRGSKVGQRLSITVLRKGQTLKLSLKLKARPN